MVVYALDVQGLQYSSHSIRQLLKKEPQTTYRYMQLHQKLFGWLCRGQRKTTKNKLSVSDSWAALISIRYGKYCRQDVLFEIHHLLYRMQNKGQTVCFIWVPAHVGVTRNEEVYWLNNHVPSTSSTVPHSTGNAPSSWFANYQSNLKEVGEEGCLCRRRVQFIA